MKTSGRLVLHSKKPKELSIDLTSDKKLSKEDFVMRLKWADKSGRDSKNQQEIDELVCLHNANHYELEPSELELLKRLRCHNEAASNPKKPVYVLRMNSSEKSLGNSMRGEFRRSTSRNNLSKAFK